VGKIHDIFAARGMTETIYTVGNADGMAKTLALADRDFRGLCFVNLVDFDMLYGHRNNIDGYAAALTAFDQWLPGFLAKLGPDDCVLLTADHGCDPGYPTTDHTREYTPMVLLGEAIRPVSLGTRPTFSDIGATVAELLGARLPTLGTSFAADVLRGAV
jgi:phosphopentomutase